MINLTIDDKKANVILNDKKISEKIKKIKNSLYNKLIYKDYIGWLNINETLGDSVDYINLVSEKLRDKVDTLVVIGIGGSYLGTLCAKEYLYEVKKPDKEIKFAGYNLNSNCLNNLVSELENKNFAINVISKSGGTLETILTYKVLKELIIKKFPNDYHDRIVITTNSSKGFLFEEVTANDFVRLDVPDNIGGRYSVLTAVGLFPLAFIGYDIKEILMGAKRAYEEFFCDNDIASSYAKTRYYFYKQKKSIELFVTYDSDLNNLSYWLQQLFAESEGKNKKGLFPVPLHFSRDLHSVGQFIQDGPSLFLETHIIEKKDKKDITKPFLPPYDNYMPYEKEKLNQIEYVMYNATKEAHLAAKVSSITIEFLKKDLETFGYLILFFELSCALSACLLDENPFNQPGVELYKSNMKKLFS